jgi:hypothetical protein
MIFSNHFNHPSYPSSLIYNHLKMFLLIFSAERTFIMTGVDLPSPSSDLEERQLQLKQTAKTLIVKLDPALSVHNITYVRVVKSPKPSILEVECETVDR